jgi:DNA-binding transcriptional MerR regulator
VNDEGPAEDLAPPPKPPRPPGGRRRSQADIDVLINRIDSLLQYAVPRSQVIDVMRKEHQLPPRTCDKYIAIVRQRWAESATDRETAKQRQILRLYAQLRSLQAAGDHREVRHREILLAKIEGTLAPLQLSAVIRSTWDELMPEQIKYIIENNGKLPPGVTAEMLFPRK